MSASAKTNSSRAIQTSNDRFLPSPPHPRALAPNVWFVDPVHVAPGPVCRALVVDDLVPALITRAGGPGLGHDEPVGHRLARVLAPPRGDGVGDVGDARAEDERQPRRFDGLLVCPRRSSPRRHDRHIRHLVGGHGRGDRGQHRRCLDLVEPAYPDDRRPPHGTGRSSAWPICAPVGDGAKPIAATGAPEFDTAFSAQPAAPRSAAVDDVELPAFRTVHTDHLDGTRSSHEPRQQPWPWRAGSAVRSASGGRWPQPRRFG